MGWFNHQLVKSGFLQSKNRSHALENPQRNQAQGPIHGVFSRVWSKKNRQVTPNLMIKAFGEAPMVGWNPLFATTNWGPGGQAT